MPLSLPFRGWLLVLAPLAITCGGAQRVQLYEGARLPDDQVSVLWTNPRLEIEVDRQYKLAAADSSRLYRIELPPGNHAVEVRCLYPDEKVKVSPTIALLLDGEAGHSYKPRVQFIRGADGVPGCKTRLFDVTAQPSGHTIDLF